MDLTDEESENLIELVSQHPPLYDCQHRNYKDQSVRDNIWWNIAQELNTTSDSCKKQWKTIRDGYSRFKRKNKLPTGSAAPKNKRTKWKIYRLLTFLDNASQEGSSIGIDESSLDESESPQYTGGEFSDSAQHNIKQENTVTAFVEIPVSPLDEDIPQVKNRKRTNSDRDDVLSYIKERDILHDSLIKNICQNNNRDEYNSFANHIEHVLKKLPPLLKIKAKQEIFEVLTKYEMKSVDDSTSSSQDTTS